MQSEIESEDQIRKEMEDGRIKNERISVDIQKDHKQPRYPKQMNSMQKNQTQKNL